MERRTPGDDDRRKRALDHGLECLRRIKGDTTWEDWLGIGEALMVVTEDAMEEVGAHVWDANNRRLIRHFSDLWEEYEAQAGSNQKPLSKQERWALREVMTNPGIGAWRSTLDGPKRRKLNHPNKVIERWKRETQTPDTPAEKKSPSPSLSTALREKENVNEQLNARITELEEELADAKQKAGDGIEDARGSYIEAARKLSKEKRVDEMFALFDALDLDIGRDFIIPMEIGGAKKAARKRKPK